MLRSVFSARSARSLMPVFRQKNRTFATPPIKDQSPPSPIDRSGEQAHPLGAYYESILQKPQPIPAVKPEEPPASASTTSSAPAQPAPSEPEPVPAKRGRKPKPASSLSSSVSRTTTSSSLAPQPPAPDVGQQSSDEQGEEASSNTSASVQDRARLVFGSRIGDPAPPVRKFIPTLSVAGVLVPPRPEEPDNCCMSGCVNCVWDAYRDEMEAWAAAKAEVEARTLAAASVPADGARVVVKVAAKEETVGDDAAWSRMGAARSPGHGKMSKDFWDEELYRNVPVGIKEFMKHEKRLKEKHAQEGTLGA